MEIIKLKAKDIEQTTKLFYDSIKDNNCFRYLFDNHKRISTKLKKDFNSHISYCIKSGKSLGITENNELIGFILCFDYKKTQKEQNYMFNNMFSINKNQNFKKNTKIHKILKKTSGEVLYIYYIAVNSECDMKEVASKLLDYVMWENPVDSISGNIFIPDLIPVFKNRNFKIKRIEKGFYLSFLPTAVKEGV